MELSTFLMSSLESEKWPLVDRWLGIYRTNNVAPEIWNYVFFLGPLETIFSCIWSIFHAGNTDTIIIDLNCKIKNICKFQYFLFFRYRFFAKKVKNHIHFGSFQDTKWNHIQQRPNLLSASQLQAPLQCFEYHPPNHHLNHYWVDHHLPAHRFGFLQRRLLPGSLLFSVYSI